MPEGLVGALLEEEELCEQEKWEECGMRIDVSTTALGVEDVVLTVDGNTNAEGERTFGALHN
jgi:hypothetical protein